MTQIINSFHSVLFFRCPRSKGWPHHGRTWCCRRWWVGCIYGWLSLGDLPAPAVLHTKWPTGWCHQCNEGSWLFAFQFNVNVVCCSLLLHLKPVFCVCIAVIVTGNSSQISNLMMRNDHNFIHFWPEKTFTALLTIVTIQSSSTDPQDFQNYYCSINKCHIESYDKQWGVTLTMVDMCKNADIANVSGILLQWYQLLHIRPLHPCFLQLLLSLDPHAQPQTNGRHLAG